MSEFIFSSTSSSASEKALHARSDLHLLRKLWHMGGVWSLILLYKFHISIYVLAVAMILVGVFSFIVDQYRVRNDELNQFFLRFVSPLMRENEKSGPTGFTLYAIGIGLSALIFPERIAVLSILFLLFADPVSSFFGILFGKDKILPGKSLQGSLAGFCVCYLITLFYSLHFHDPSLSILFFAVFAGFVGALSELCSNVVDDNLSIPLLSGVGIWLLNFIFHVF